MFWPGDPERGCSCGVPVDQCPFWTEVRAQLGQRTPLLEELERGQRRYESWAGFWRSWGKRPGLNEGLDAHVSRMEQFLRVIAQQAGAQTIVESSYSAVRGRLYRRADLGGGRVRFLHLVRDGRSFLASERSITFDPEAPWPWLRWSPVIIARWVLFNFAALLLRLRDPGSYLRVRYEELVLRPAETLARIGDFLQLDLTDVARRVTAGEAIPMQHLAAANRMRLLGRVSLRSDMARPPRLPLATSALFWVCGGWLALLLGYRPR